MIVISVCVGSSCHLKGSEKLVELFQNRIGEEKLDDEIVLVGSFCLGKCNREGVTVAVGDGVTEDSIITGITPEGLPKFWETQIIPRLEGEH